MWHEENTHRIFVRQQWSVILLLLTRNKPSVPVAGGCHINRLDTNPVGQSAMSACYVVLNSLITFCGVLYGAFSLVDYRPTASNFRISDDQEGFGKKSSDVIEMLSFDSSKFLRKPLKMVVSVVFVISEIQYIYLRMNSRRWLVYYPACLQLHFVTVTEYEYPMHEGFHTLVSWEKCERNNKQTI